MSNLKINAIEGTGKFSKKVMKKINSVNKKKETTVNDKGDKLYNLMIQNFNDKISVFYNHVNLKGKIITPYMTVNSNTGVFIIYNINLKVMATINNIEISKKNKIKVNIVKHDSNSLDLLFNIKDETLKEEDDKLIPYTPPVILNECVNKIKKYKPTEFVMDEVDNSNDYDIFLNIHGTIYNFKLGELMPYNMLDDNVDRFYYKGRIFSRRHIGRGYSMVDIITYEHFRSLSDNYMFELVQPIIIEKF